MPQYNRKKDFELGLSQLIPFFDSLGFIVTRGEPDIDKAGTSYSARFVRSPRSVGLSHLYSLGPVLYSIREFSVEHTFYTQGWDSPPLLSSHASSMIPCRVIRRCSTTLRICYRRFSAALRTTSSPLPNATCRHSNSSMKTTAAI